MILCTFLPNLQGVEIERARQSMFVEGLSLALSVTIVPVGSDEPVEAYYDDEHERWEAYIEDGKEHILNVGPARLNWVGETYLEKKFIAKKGMTLRVPLHLVTRSVAPNEALLLRSREQPRLLAVIRGQGKNAYYISCVPCRMENGRATWTHRVAEPGSYRAILLDPAKAREKTMLQDALQVFEYTVAKKELAEDKK